MMLGRVPVVDRLGERLACKAAFLDLVQYRRRVCNVRDERAEALYRGLFHARLAISNAFIEQARKRRRPNSAASAQSARRLVSLTLFCHTSRKTARPESEDREKSRKISDPAADPAASARRAPGMFSRRPHE